MAIYEIPLSPDAQQFSIALGENTYRMSLQWGTVNNTWLLNLDNDSGVRILSGIPLVGGVDLFADFAYLNLGGALYATTEGDAFAAPTYSNLGTLGRVIFVTP